MFDFKLFKKGDDEPLGSMSFSHKWQRSGTLRLELEEGEYVVHVRLDRFVDSDKVRAHFSLTKFSLLTERRRNRTTRAKSLHGIKERCLAFGVNLREVNPSLRTLMSSKLRVLARIHR